MNHPNICTIHDVGHQDGITYLVMEYLDGETLADRLKKGALPLEQVLKVGMRMSGRWTKRTGAAWCIAIFKPGNIMLTKSGAKLMDFGLATARPAVSRESSPSTTTRLGGEPMTGQGTVLGTFPYMSPEQLEGRPGGHALDIFSLGAVLYEMVTGRRAFDGKTAASVIAAVMERDPPPISAVQQTSPRALNRLVEHCLLKDRDERWQTAHDTLLELQGLYAEAPLSPAVSRRRQRPWLAWVVTAMFGLAAVFLLLRNTRPTFNRPIRSSPPFFPLRSVPLPRSTSRCRPTGGDSRLLPSRPMATHPCGFARSPRVRRRNIPAPPTLAFRSGPPMVSGSASSPKET